MADRQSLRRVKVSIHSALGVTFEASILSVVTAERESTIDMPRDEHLFKGKVQL